MNSTVGVGRLFSKPSLEVQDCLLASASPGRCEVKVSDAGVVGDVVGTVLDADHDCNLEGAVGLYEVVQKALKRCLRQLQDSCSARNQRVPTNLLEVFRSLTKPNGGFDAIMPGVVEC